MARFVFRFVFGSFFPQARVFNNFSGSFFKKGILFCFCVCETGVKMPAYDRRNRPLLRGIALYSSSNHRPRRAYPCIQNVLFPASEPRELQVCKSHSPIVLRLPYLAYGSQAESAKSANQAGRIRKACGSLAWTRVWLAGYARCWQGLLYCSPVAK